MEAQGLLYYGGSDIGNTTSYCYHDQNPATEQQHFMVDDLLDFSNEQDGDALTNDGVFDLTTYKNIYQSYDESSSSGFASNDSCNSSGNASYYRNVFLADPHFSNELCVPYDDMVELEWLSNFVEDSFSTQHNLHINPSETKPNTPEPSSSETHPAPITPHPSNHFFPSQAPLRRKAQSKRSRAAPCDWSTCLVHVSPTTKAPSTKKETSIPHSNGMVRRCLHCASEKTPQWRTGPMGPKTLCNACGVRYKSGRLVPEYRPSASPTFVPSKHSNSHRKVLELRRQNDLHRVHQEQHLNQSSIFVVPNGGDHDFMIHRHNGPTFRNMIK